MKVNCFSSVEQYYERTKDYLLQSEANHALILGLVDALINFPQRFQRPPYLATVEEEENDRILAVALQIPPRKLILSQTQDCEAVEAIAQDFHSQQKLLVGVIGPVPATQIFASRWQALTGKTYREGMVQRCFQIETVQPLAKVSGDLRQGSLADRQLLRTWCQAFSEEALNNVEQENAENVVDRLLHQGSLYIWQDQIPVSMANYTGRTPNGMRINLVYTPPQFRGQGYATACVAALSQTLLNRGYKYCFLFADLSNPTSNHLYRKIGYQPVGDQIDYWFES